MDYAKLQKNTTLRDIHCHVIPLHETEFSHLQYAEVACKTLYHAFYTVLYVRGAVKLISNKGGLYY
jgi:hypothetical protein